MKVGPEPRKLAILVVLAVVAAYMLYTNVWSDSTQQSAAPSSSANPAPRVEAPSREAARPAERQPARSRPSTGRAGLEEFRPSLKLKPPEERLDPGSIDPTLRLDLLARLQAVQTEEGARSLFEFRAAPTLKTPEPKILPKTPGQINKETAESKTQEPAAKPPLSPIPLKFYGYLNQSRQGNKRAFFLDGDEIFVASEGEIIKRRYKVVRIGVNSVVVEDIENQRQQTLPLEEQAG